MPFELMCAAGALRRPQAQVNGQMGERGFFDAKFGSHPYI